jgi:hypothetical protein
MEAAFFGHWAGVRHALRREGMRWYYKVPLRLRSIFHKNQAELDLSEELQFHLQNQIDEYVAQGMNPKEARHAAFRSMGGIEQAKEECRDTRRVNVIDNFLQDVRFGLRMLRRSPGFSILAILCLTLGIGANAAVLSWVEGILFRPYPLVSHQERLLALAGTARDEKSTETSWPDLLDLQRNCKLLDSLFVSKITGASRKLRFMTEHPLVCGLFFGAAVQEVMDLVVLPLSALHARGPYKLHDLILGLLVHMVVIGLPISFSVRQYAS